MKAVKTSHARLAVSTALLAGAAFVARPALATPVTLQDGNASLGLNVVSNGTPSQDGAFTWDINGVNQLDQQWFWFRVGNSGAGQEITSLSESGSPALADTDGGGDDNYASINYSGSGFAMNVQYMLSGGSSTSHVADVDAIIRILNKTSKALVFDLADYGNFTLGSAGGDRAISITNNNTATESNSAGAAAQVIVSPAATQYDASDAATLAAGLDSGALLPLPDNSSTSGADPAFAFGYDLTIPANGSYVISSDEQIITAVPEPTSGMAALAGSCLILVRRRRRDEE